MAGWTLEYILEAGMNGFADKKPEDFVVLIYIAATTQVVSAATVVERREEGHALPIQRPVYFISEVLSETKIRYPQI